MANYHKVENFEVLVGLFDTSQKDEFLKYIADRGIIKDFDKHWQSYKKITTKAKPKPKAKAKAKASKEEPSE